MILLNAVFAKKAMDYKMENVRNAYRINSQINRTNAKVDWNNIFRLFETM